jgi:hypothetical protein
MSKTMCRIMSVFNLELYVDVKTCCNYLGLYVCECEVMFVNVNTYVN